jgi:hypothetical protein
LKITTWNVNSKPATPLHGLLDALDEPAVRSHQPYWVTAHLHRRCGQAQARAALERAIGCRRPAGVEAQR